MLVQSTECFIMTVQVVIFKHLLVSAHFGNVLRFQLYTEHSLKFLIFLFDRMVHTSQPRKQLQSTPQQFTGWRAEDSHPSPSHPFHTSMTLSCSFLHLRDLKKLTGVIFVLLERNTKLLNAESVLTQLNLSTTAIFGIEERGHCREV